MGERKLTKKVRTEEARGGVWKKKSFKGKGVPRKELPQDRKVSPNRKVQRKSKHH